MNTLNNKKTITHSFSSQYAPTDPNSIFNNFKSQLEKSPQIYINRNLLSQTYNVFNTDANWGNEIREYCKEKTSPNLGIKHPEYKKMTSNFIKTMDRYFNPITQKYSDPKLDKKIQETENQRLLTKLSKYYDKELENTQTFNIINLKDKLKGFENSKNYPKTKIKTLFTKERNPSLQNYNIISNLSLAQHHYDKPENRKLTLGDIKKVCNKSHNKMATIAAIENPDYNIISNEYKFLDKEKKQIDKEINDIKTAKKLLTEREYDIIKGVYYDSDKEKKYQNDLNLQNLKLRTAKRDTLFNPFNNVVYDEEKLKLSDMCNKNSKLRYLLRNQIENYYHEKDLNKFTKLEKNLKNKIFYDRFNIIDKRGYNIINGGSSFNIYKNTLNCIVKKSPWEIIQIGSDKKNETITSKGLYKFFYDKSDIEQNSIEYKLKREKLLKTLVPPEQDRIFTVKEFNKKPKFNTIQNERKRSMKLKFNIDKKRWFSKDKNVNMKIK